MFWREAGSLNPTLEEKVWVVWREAGSLNPPDPLSKGGGARRVKNLGQKFGVNICLPFFSPAGTPLPKGGQGGFNQPRQALTPRQAPPFPKGAGGIQPTPAGPHSPAGTPLSKGGQGGFNQPRQALTPRQAKKIFSKTIAMFRKSCTFAASNEKRPF